MHAQARLLQLQGVRRRFRACESGLPRGDMSGEFIRWGAAIDADP